MQTLSEKIYMQTNQVVQDAYDALVASLCSSKPVPKTICVTGGAPGVGKTTTSINLAIALAMAGYSALWIDSDIRKTNKDKRLGTDELLGLSDFLSGTLEIDEALTLTNIENLTVMTCGRINSRNPLGLYYSKRFDHLMEIGAARYDMVIFDSSSLDANVDSSVIASKTEATLLVVQINDSARSLERDIARLDLMGANIVGTVLNKIPKEEYKSRMEYYNHKHNYIK